VTGSASSRAYPASRREHAVPRPSFSFIGGLLNDGETLPAMHDGLHLVYIEMSLTSAVLHRHPCCVSTSVILLAAPILGLLKIKVLPSFQGLARRNLAGCRQK
jgi:hypothetical protein